MSDNNIQKFDRLTGAIFAKLYAAFPVHVPLTHEEFRYLLLPEEEIEGLHFSESGELKQRSIEFFFSSIEWLTVSGYIIHKGSTPGNPHTYQCVLSAKALEALKSTPSNLGGDTLGSKIADAAKAGTKSVLGELSSQALGIALSALTSQFH
ncbi:hypothetical protein HX805_15770 [Pseudomonas sp. G5001]|uniref:hypothetical protein n=1 Tax=Pseudomonas sp. G5001 TaxID=2738824 RepID=UPI0015A23B2F|nr:hypothetical protein [Pseudomonas sp. G5001]NWB73918.1 hypothetical protein [Pseudomonas sp. G5001]